MVLLTGGTGLIGSHLLYDLVHQGDKVRVFTRNNNKHFVENIFDYYSNGSETGFSAIEWINGDILDIFALEDAMQGVDQIYHCAALVSFHPKDKGKLFKINVEGTANVVNAALEKGVSKICHISSIAALGREENEGVITEETVWKRSRKNSVYSISKYGAEREVWRGIAEGLNAIILNPSVVIGPSDIYKGSAELFYTVYKGLRFYTRGINGFVDVRDVARAMILLMNSDKVNERYIVSAENITYQELFNLIAKCLDKKPPTIYANSFISNFAWRVEKVRSMITGKLPLVTKETTSTAHQVYEYSSEKIRRDYNFEFIPIQNSIQNMCRFFMNEINSRC